MEGPQGADALLEQGELLDDLGEVESLPDAAAEVRLEVLLRALLGARARAERGEIPREQVPQLRLGETARRGRLLRLGDPGVHDLVAVPVDALGQGGHVTSRAAAEAGITPDDCSKGA
jgi:hypothetical protein